MKQAMYPFILVATVYHFLFWPSDLIRPAAWLITLIGVAFVKSLYGWAITGDPLMTLFSLYGIFYFFGLLPSKIWALLTVNRTAWGTSARSASEIRRGESL